MSIIRLYNCLDIAEQWPTKQALAKWHFKLKSLLHTQSIFMEGDLPLL